MGGSGAVLVLAICGTAVDARAARLAPCPALAAAAVPRGGARGGGASASFFGDLYDFEQDAAFAAPRRGGLGALSKLRAARDAGGRLALPPRFVHWLSLAAAAAAGLYAGRTATAADGRVEALSPPAARNSLSKRRASTGRRPHLPTRQK